MNFGGRPGYHQVQYGTLCIKENVFQHFLADQETVILHDVVGGSGGFLLRVCNAALRYQKSP